MMAAFSDRPECPRARFEREFRRHYRHVLAFALRRVGDRPNAEDAASETFAVAWRRREQIPEDALPWLYAVAIRVIANQRRSTQRKRRLHKRMTEEPARDWHSTADPAELVSDRSAFFSAFARLSDSERETLRLVAWDGLEPRQAARVLDCTPAAFRVRVFRARRQLAKQLERAEQITGEPIERRRGSPAEEPG